jgi:hypothetical protein
MRITKVLLICVCCLMSMSVVWGQSANSQARPGILGYLDPRTGAFHTIVPPVEDAAAIDLPPAPAVFNGTLNLTITVTVKSVGITTVVCSAQLSVTDLAATPRLIDESNSVTASGTGATRTCKLSIPYSWGLVAQALDTMTTSYIVVGSASATNTLPNRTSSLSPIDSRKVPANGAVTSLTAAVTI